jgi:hypothetical protein
MRSHGACSRLYAPSQDLPRHVQDLRDLTSAQSGSINNLFDADPFDKQPDDPSTLKEGNSRSAFCRSEPSLSCLPITVSMIFRALASTHGASLFFGAKTSL